jgi:hypothetical protein
LFDIGDGDRAAVIAGDIMADADGQKLNQSPAFDHRDDLPQVALEIVRRIDAEG